MSSPRQSGLVAIDSIRISSLSITGIKSSRRYWASAYVLVNDWKYAIYSLPEYLLDTKVFALSISLTAKSPEP